MELGLERQAPMPLVEQLVAGLERWLGSRKARPGTRLPSIRHLARSNAVSPSSVVEAYARLVARGLLEARQGSGYFVSQAPAAEARPGPAPAHRWGLFEPPAGQLGLGCGWLPDDWRDVDAVGHAIRRVTRHMPTSLFSYNSPLGLPALRELLLRRLAAIQVHCGLDQILTTQGASHALDLIVRGLLQPGDCVIVESPGYYNLFNLLRLHQIRILSVPRLADGPDPAAVAALLRQHRPRLMFINSLYQNPTGTSLSPSVAHQLLSLAEAHDFLLVEDDIYADFQNTPSTRLAALDGLGRVIYLASFSKTLSSSLRVGYLAGPAPLIERLADITMCTGLGSQRFAEQVVADLLGSGAWLRSMVRLRQRLASHMADALRLLSTHGWAVFTQPHGGMFIWARLPGATFAHYQAIAAACGVGLAPGAGFQPDEQATDWLRLNVAYINDPRARDFLREAASSLGSAIHQTLRHGLGHAGG